MLKLFKVICGIGMAVSLAACSEEAAPEPAKKKEVATPVKEEVEPVEEEKPVEKEPAEPVVVEEKVEESAEPVKEPFDKQAFLDSLAEEMDYSFGGTDPTDWFKVITKYDVDYETKTLYAYTTIPSFNDDLTFDMTTAMMNLTNGDPDTYFHIETFVIINAIDREISFIDNRM